MRVAFETLGCKANQADTQAMMALLENAGYEIVAPGGEADVVVVNTCTVTNISDRKSRQTLSRAKRKHPDAVLVAAGCYAQRAPKELLALGADIAVGTDSFGDIAKLLEKARGAKLDAVTAISDTFFAAPAKALGKTRASLKIQDGCDRFCSYCIIPHTRGKPRSRPLGDVLEQARALAEQGYEEIVLTGIHLASYGKEFGLTLLDALREVCTLVPRVRLGSLEPMLLTGAFIEELAALPQVCRHFHVSLQSGSEEVLASMNRRYTPGQYLEGIEALRERIAGAAITTDIIAGFPGETEEAHERTKAFMRSAHFAKVHVFPYSRRNGTPAAKMVQLPLSVRQGRARELIQIGNALESEFKASSLGTVADVLVETVGNGVAFGHTDTYLYARVPGCESFGVKRVRLVSDGGDHIECEEVRR